MIRGIATLAAVALIVMVAFTDDLTLAIAQSQSYKFEPVSEEIPVGKNVRIEVRLVDPEDEPVAAERIELATTRLDMGPDGMAMMDAPLTVVASNAPGVLAFETRIVSAGRWALKIEAHVKGEAELVKGEIIYTAVKK